MKILKTNFFALALLMIASGCEHTYEYSYTVTNQSDGQIKISVKTFGVDSTFSIPKDSTKLLFSRWHGLEGNKGPYFHDVKLDLVRFSVTRNDTIKSTRDYLNNDAWTFNKGNYSTTVTNDEFK